MAEEFKRSDDIPYPVIHYKFTARSLETDELVEYHVRDLTEGDVEEAIDIILKYLVPEETFQKAMKLAENDYMPKMMTAFYEKVFQERFSLACFATQSNELVGVNALNIKSKGEKPNYEIKIEEIVAALEAMDFVADRVDVFEKFNVDHYLYGSGLCVKKSYRGRGIATEILKARAPLLKHVNIQVTSTLFTTKASQRCAVLAGYQELSSVSYDEIHSKYPLLDFSEATATHCKVLALEVNP